MYKELTVYTDINKVEFKPAQIISTKFKGKRKFYLLKWEQFSNEYYPYKSFSRWVDARFCRTVYIYSPKSWIGKQIKKLLNKKYKRF